MEALETLSEEIFHYPVMHREVLKFLEPTSKKIIVDCTIGVGSCALKLLEVTSPTTLFIGIDRDNESLDIAANRLKKFGSKVILIKDNFMNIDKILEGLNLKSADAFLFDLGISSYQLNKAERGFSFLKEGPLDMRMDKDTFLCAYDLVNNLSREELANIFKKFGEERFADRIAKVLVDRRKKEPISTTKQLAELILHTVPIRSYFYRINPATRIFQALRIAVNRELETLNIGLQKAINLLNQRGRIVVISFHSLEDRIVKNIFRQESQKGKIKIITKKPIIPTAEEIAENNASRSAKLRVAEKL
ncbi:MAG: 16S rRNA (cytosine(1402)-N(4))-methyltransferase RsmH [Candidatus Omnitrophica bacterium]|nr:16S rRNA (cytosine(1402)-N(4))-methyltransferase RsmH [Candidatus Omnitrophota bacterium]MCM8830926.1 16S rRNA (cytosine(1402)-N(4))-methyltransferase RsmH [Candidatus Omnitrophota bacterium]